MKILILISGRRCSGKSYLANILSDKYDFVHYEMSSIAKELRKREDKEYLRLRNFVGQEHKKKGKSFLMEYLIKIIDESEHEKIVVSGIRHLEETLCIPKKNYRVEWFYIHDSLISRLNKTINRPERTSVLDFFIEEYFAIKWKDYLLKRNAMIIDKRKKEKAIVQLEKVLIHKKIISTTANNV
jgi:cytidylate kinase